MWQPESEHQFAEISIVGDQHTILCDRNGEDILICECPRVLMGDGCRVMSSSPQVTAQRQICAFVQQKSHRRWRYAGWSSWGNTSSPWITDEA